MLVSACGLACNKCPFFNNPCTGCYTIEGQTFWAKETMENRVCPLFDCAVHQNHFNSCGECHQLPCKQFTELKDPNISEEEHQASLLKRINLLRSE